MTAVLEQPTTTLSPSCDMLIGGRRVAGQGKTMTVLNPATGEPVASFPGASEDQFREAIAAARKAFDSGVWSGKTPLERVEILRKFVDLLAAREQEFIDLIVAETGCPPGSMLMGAQVGACFKQGREVLDLYLKLPEVEEQPLTMDERITAQGGTIQSLRRYVPMGVVAAIAAYNFPLYIATWKIMPSMATGNCVILRPSPLTPLNTLAIAESAAEAGLPDGVLNILAEPGAEGAVLLSTEPGVDMVGFTGSSDVGKKVMAQASGTMKRVQLELGGKSAQIYLPDQVEAANTAALSVLMGHAGQGCVLGTRILVPESEKAKVLEGMKATVGAVRIGDPHEPTTTMSPVISQAQADRCQRFVDLAVAAGGKVVTGGKRADRPGFYFEPTILDVPDNSNPAAQEEIFGPVVCVIGYRDIDHAVEMANDSAFGLSGYIYGKDMREATAVARRIKSGTVNVNGQINSTRVSSGGHKQSGLGRERGIEGIRVYQEVQTFNMVH
ncbi:MAG TPA: aldehyde dehydrogenase family protein [Novosphingobium sp.]|nr:aldehyde dehydrogenase family protein [Novosphingobium sp.]